MRPGRWARRPSRCLLAPAGSEALVGEVADLWFHSMVLLARDGLDPLAPLEVLAARHAGRV